MLALGYSSTPLFSLVTWGNAWLQHDLPMRGVYHRSSCFRPWRDYHQVLPGLDGRTYDPLDWLEHIRGESRILGLRHCRDPVVQDRIEVGVDWVLSVHGAGQTSLIASPRATGYFAPEVLWSGAEDLPLVRAPLDEAEAGLRAVLEEGLAFTGADDWSGLFQGGLNALDGTQDFQCLGDNMTPRVRVEELMPKKHYGPQCWSLLGASLLTNLPGAGMGGWSEYAGPPGTMDGWTRAGEIATRLREARILAGLSVLNLHSV
ncbi:MAG TPA: hypothetical protein QGF58_29325 [Myxococcota bacterium]|nr:hypothetical protein [Myxococcota bacterium]